MCQSRGTQLTAVALTAALVKSIKQSSALLGFGFVTIWIALRFGEAVLCLLGALVFWAVSAFVRGKLDLADLQSRLVRRT
jgi:hypothetical protein